MVRIVGGAFRRRAAAVFAVCLGSSLIVAPAALAACQPVNRVISNGNPFATPGAVMLTVDGLGAFGSSLTGDPVVFSPPFEDVSAAGTVFESALYASPADEMLLDDCDGQTVVETFSDGDELHTATQVGNVQLDLVQRLTSATSTGSTLIQRYRFENVGDTSVPLTLVRHLDTDLRFDGSARDGAAMREDGRQLLGFDSTNAINESSTFVAISGRMGSRSTPDAWSVQPFRFTDNIVGAGAIPSAARNAMHGDGDSNSIVDAPGYDTTLSQEWTRSTSLGPGGAVTFVTRTRFGAGDVNLPPIAPDLPAQDDPTIQTSPGGQVVIDLLEHAEDPDGDRGALTLHSVTQPSNGSVVCDGGVCTYTTFLNGAGADSFTYKVVDPDGGVSAAGTVSITIPAAGALAAVDDVINTTETVPVEFVDILENDGGDIVDVDVAATGSQGSAMSCDFGVCTYTPAAGVSGTETFLYTISDGNENSDTGKVIAKVEACPDLRQAISGQPGLVTGQEWIACSHPTANGTNTKSTPMMPSPHGSYGVMTSGDRSLVDRAGSTIGSDGESWGTTLRGANDVSILKLDLNVPAGHDCLSFRTVFASEEYPEFQGSSFNDAFLAELGESTWMVDGPLITAPGNIAFDPDGDVLSINSDIFDEALSSTGTEYDGASPLVLVRGDVEAGPVSLFLSIFDASDDIYDSAAFVDRLATGTTTGGCDEGAVLFDGPPGAVGGLKVLAGRQGGNLVGNLTWNNPDDQDFDRVVIRRKTGTQAASSESDGTGIFDDSKNDDTDGVATSTKALDLDPAQNYTFTAFAFDDAGNRSAGSSVRLLGTELMRLLPDTSRTTILDPNSATLRWRLRRADNDAPLGNRTVRLFAKRATVSSFDFSDPVAAAQTNDNGVVTFAVAPKRNHDYQARFVGGGSFLGSDDGLVEVLFRPRVTAALSDGSIDLGERTAINGTVSRYYEGRRLFLQQLVDGSWSKVASKVLGAPSGGSIPVSFQVRPATPGTHAYRLFLPRRTDVHVPGRSPKRQIDVS